MHKAKDLRDQTVEELEANHYDLQKEIYGLRNQAKEEGNPPKPHEIRERKRDVARIKTILREKANQNQRAEAE